MYLSIVESTSSLLNPDLEDRDRIQGGDSHRVSLNYCDIEFANAYQLSKSGFNKDEVDSTIDK